MKDSLRNSKLWQQKRNELKVNTNPDQDWSEMHNLLDQHLPVSPKGNLPGGGASGLAKMGGIAGISAAVIGVTIYLVAHFSGNKVDKVHRDSISFKQQTAVVSKQGSIITSRDSTINRADETTASNKDSYGVDSASAIKSLANTVAASSASVNPSDVKSGSVNSATVKTGLANTAGLKGGSNSVNKNGSNGSVPNSRSNTAAANGKSTPLLSKFGKGAGGASLGNNGRRGGATSGLVKNGRGRQNNSVSLSANPQRPNNGQGRNRDQTQSQTKSGVTDLTKQGNGKSTKEVVANADKGKPQRNEERVAGKGRDSIMRDNNVGEGFPRLKQSDLISNNSSNNSVKPYVIKPPERSKTDNEELSKTKDKKPKSEKAPSASDSKFDYGILGGANASNSFALYGGVYGAYHITDKWGVNAQVLGLTTQNISGGYSHTNGSKVDSGKIIQVVDSRKAYFVTVPLHVTYKITDNFSVKAGPVLSIPVKQTNGVTSLTPTTISKDTVYYRKTIGQINATKYDQQINLGLSGGVRYRYNRFSIEATYIKSLSGFNVTSDYGTYKTNGSGMLNITLGIQLNRVKNKVLPDKPRG